MTKEDIKKALEICNDIDRSCTDCPYDNVTNCSDTLKHDMYKLIIEQEKSTQMAQDRLLILAQQNQEYREQQVKQAKIDILNKVKSLVIYDDNYLDGYVFIDDINDLIEEVEDGEDKG